jgi:hypothetical protein
MELTGLWYRTPKEQKPVFLDKYARNKLVCM